MGQLKSILVEIDEAIEAGAERREAVTDALIRWDIDPTSSIALALERVYLEQGSCPEDSTTIPAQEPQ